MRKATFAFIDASNVIYGTKAAGWAIDLKKLYEYLKKRYGVNRAYYYAGCDPKNAKQVKLLSYLRSWGYIPRIKELRYYQRQDGRLEAKANCDVDMTFDMMRYLGEYSQAIILTGDGDFKVVIEFLIKQGRAVKIIANPKNTAQRLKRMAGGNFTDINKLKEEIELIKK